MAETGNEGASGWAKSLNLNGFASIERTQARAEIETQSTKTPKQRARKRVKTTSINFRTPPEVKDLAQKLAAHLDGSTALAVETALIEFCRTVPALKKHAASAAEKLRGE